MGSRKIFLLDNLFFQYQQNNTLAVVTSECSCVIKSSARSRPPQTIIVIHTSYMYQCPIRLLSEFPYSFLPLDVSSVRMSGRLSGSFCRFLSSDGWFPEWASSPTLNGQRQWNRNDMSRSWGVGLLTGSAAAVDCFRCSTASPPWSALQVHSLINVNCEPGEKFRMPCRRSFVYFPIRPQLSDQPILWGQTASLSPEMAIHLQF